MNKYINIEIENFYQLKVTCDKQLEGRYFAYYIIKNNEVILKSNYTSNREFKYNLDTAGIYRVRVFVKLDNNEKRVFNTSNIEYKKVKEELQVYCKKDIYIYGVSKISAFVKIILEKKFNIIGFITENPILVGKKYFGSEIVFYTSIDLCKNNVIYCFKGNNSNSMNGYEQFLSYTFETNIVSDYLKNINAMDLYDLAKKCYNQGLIQGANYLKRLIYLYYNCVIPYTAQIGAGTSLGYAGIGVIIHKDAVIGENCKISQNVTIGARGNLKPQIGNNVFIGPGAKCIGGIIGDNVVIGANSVVTKQIESNCIVAGVPAKVISTEIDNYKNYFKR